MTPEPVPPPPAEQPELVDPATPPTATPPKPRPTTRNARGRSLPGGMPRKFPDHRTVTARRYREAYQAIIESLPPKNRLGRIVAGIAADSLVEYMSIRRGHKKGARQRRRKLVTQLFGLFRELRNLGAAPVTGQTDLDHALRELMEERR